MIKPRSHSYISPPFTTVNQNYIVLWKKKNYLKKDFGKLFKSEIGPTGVGLEWKGSANENVT